MANRKEILEIKKISDSLIPNIPGRTERMFYIFLTKIFPDSEIYYESTSFTIKNGNGKEETVPDFKVVNPDGKTIFIEITKGRRNGSDPKERERRIMKEASPNTPYIVLYNEDLKKIQMENDNFDFFKSEKKRRKKDKHDKQNPNNNEKTNP